MNNFQVLTVEPSQFLSQLTDLIKSEVSKAEDRTVSRLINLSTPKQNEYLSIADVCKRFQVTKPTVHDWRKRNILKTYKLGSRVYFKFDEIEKAMQIN